MTLPCLMVERRLVYNSTAMPALQIPTHRPKTRHPASPRYRGLNQTEARALERLRRGLHAILPNGALKSLYLYGSKPRGDAHPDSDIDLFVIYDDVTSEQESELEEFTKVHFSKPPHFHIMQYRVDALERALGSSTLIYNVSRHGILLEGAAVPKHEINRRKTAARFMEKARENLQSAGLVLDRGAFDNVISLSYYAAFYAAEAALASKGLVAQSHSGTETLLTLHFIRPGLIDESFKGLLGSGHKARIRADYSSDSGFTHDDADHWLTRATEFVETIEFSLDSWLEGPPAAK